VESGSDCSYVSYLIAGIYGGAWEFLTLDHQKPRRSVKDLERFKCTVRPS
jgi:hypothetical protein